MSQSNATILARLTTHIVFSTKERRPWLKPEIRPRVWVSPSHWQAAEKYILNQEEHHRKETFQEELRRILDKYGAKYDERYLWD